MGQTPASPASSTDHSPALTAYRPGDWCAQRRRWRKPSGDAAEKNVRRRSSLGEELRRALNGCEVLFEMGEVLHVGIDHVDAVGEDKRVGPLPGRKPRLQELVAVVPIEGLLQPLTA